MARNYDDAFWGRRVGGASRPRAGWSPPVSNMLEWDTNCAAPLSAAEVEKTILRKIVAHQDSPDGATFSVVAAFGGASWAACIEMLRRLRETGVIESVVSDRRIVYRMAGLDLKGGTNADSA